MKRLNDNLENEQTNNYNVYKTYYTSKENMESLRTNTY